MKRLLAAVVTGIVSFFLVAHAHAATAVEVVAAPVTGSDDIRNYGAVCNSTSSQAANNTAIANALAAQGSAYIPACTIYVSNASLGSGQRIWGGGYSSNLVAYGTLSATGLINCAGCSGASVDHVNISVNGTQRTAGVSGITCSGCANTSVTYNTVQGNYGIEVLGSVNSTVNFNNVTAYGEASGTNGSGSGIAIQGTALDSHGYPCGGTPSVNGTVIGNNVSGAVTPGSTGSAPTPIGINICGANSIVVSQNVLNGPGYFGIALRGNNSFKNVVSANIVNLSVHEGIINAGGASFNVIDSNAISAGANSRDYCLTLDGTQGTVTMASVKNNNLYQCCLTGITVAHAVTQSSIVGNSIVNPNTCGSNAQAGIVVYGPEANFNQVSSNTIIAGSPTLGYGILEQTDGGYPSGNVYMSNSEVSMTSGSFNLQSGSTGNNNITYP